MGINHMWCLPVTQLILSRISQVFSDKIEVGIKAKRLYLSYRLSRLCCQARRRSLLSSEIRLAEPGSQLARPAACPTIRYPPLDSLETPEENPPFRAGEEWTFLTLATRGKVFPAVETLRNTMQQSSRGWVAGTYQPRLSQRLSGLIRFN